MASAALLDPRAHQVALGAADQGFVVAHDRHLGVRPRADAERAAIPLIGFSAADRRAIGRDNAVAPMPALAG